MKQTYLILFSFLMCLFFFEGRGQTFQTWRSEATNNEWQTTGNWWNFPGESSIEFGQQEWDNNNFLEQQNTENISTWRFLFRLGSDQPKTFAGNQISFFDFSGQNPRITNESNATHTINNNIVGSPNPEDPFELLIQSDGGLNFGGTLNNNGNNINVEGTTSSLTVVSFNNGISGTGGLFKTNTNIRLDFSSTNTFTGDITIQGGEVRLTSATATLGNNNDVLIGEFGFLNLNDNDATIRSVGEIGAGNGGAINLGSGTLTLSGGFDTRFQNSISGTGGFIKNGGGEISLYGNQNYTGATTINGGVLATGVDLASSDVIVNNGGMLRVTNGNEVTINDLTLADGATLNLEAGSILNVTGDFNETNINITGTGELRVIRTTTQNGNWDAQSTWENNRIPNSEYDFITINHVVNLSDSRSVQQLIISPSGDLSVSSSETLSIINGGRLENNGIFQANESALEFLGDGSISGNVSLYNLVINGQVDAGNNTTVTNKTTINPAGLFSSNAPRFVENSTLAYHVGDAFNRGIEWDNNNTSTSGTPHHVEIASGTTFFMASASGFTGEATILGNLVISEGSFNMNGFFHSDVEANNIIVNGGDIVMGNTTFGEPIQGRALVANGNFQNIQGNVTLGTGFQGDLKVRGSLFEYLTPSSTFTSQGRAVIFEGDNTINVTSTGEIIIDFVVINMSGGKVIIDNDLTIQGLSGTGGESGILLQMLDQATLDLNNKDLTLGDGTGTENFNVVMDENAKIISTPSTEITILNNGNTELRLDESGDGISNAVKNLIVNNTGTTTISNVLHIYESLDVDRATVNGNNKLIFRSSEQQTAVITEVKNGGSVTGTIRTERFFKMGNRAFRYVSPSVTSTATINAQWQEGQNNSNTTTNSNTNPGFGTHITGSLNGSNGFDTTLSGNPSLFTWNVGAQNWDAVPNTEITTLEAGKAYALMIRGDRSANLNDNEATGASTILRSVGVPKFGDTIYNSSAPVGEFVLIGNLYQAQVDLTQVETTGFTDDFYIWDASMGTFGGYALVEINSGGVVGTSTTVPDAGTEANQFLQVNQAFFKKASATSQSITFRENHKHDGIINNTTFSSPEFTRININLLRNGDLVVDGLRIDFDESYEDEVNLQDATKLWNQQEYFAIDKNPHWLMVEKRNIPENESIQFYLDNYFSSEYSLSINVQNLNTHKAFLYDAYLNESTELANNQVNTYAFEVDSNIQAMQGPHRFSLFFEEISLATETLKAETIVVYPNPTLEEVNISLPSPINGEDINLVIRDLLGRIVLQHKAMQTENKLQLKLPKEMQQGIYLLEVHTKKMQFSTNLIKK